jgi:two-component system sensor histidine kinase BaeS
MSIYVAYRLAERISSALQRLAEGVQSIARGELSARVPVPSEDELGAVSKSFNEMASKLEAARRRQARLEDERKQFTAALSHDLRTPLASARVMLEAVKDGVVSSPAEQAEYIRRSLVEINNLGELVDDLFELSLIDAGALRLELKPTPLQELVLSTAEGMSAAAGKKGLLLNLEVDEHIGDVIMDGLRVRRVLMNLIQNAIRHTPADGSVTVAAHDEGSEVKVEVKDTGEGIAAEDLPRIWTRTFRSDPSRTRDDDGLPQSGLGLATAKAIIELHGGWISATSQVGKGSAFTFSLPKRLPA